MRARNDPDTEELVDRASAGDQEAVAGAPPQTAAGDGCHAHGPPLNWPSRYNEGFECHW